jgi:hypothetical protein
MAEMRSLSKNCDTQSEEYAGACGEESMSDLFRTLLAFAPWQQ